MKWIGQHIVDLIARFRSTVYLEELSDPGTDTDKFLVSDSDGKVGYRTGSEVLSDIGAGYSEATSSDEGLMSTAHHDKLDGIEAGATADQTKSDINGLAITTVGTIDTGVWQGTAIASNYLDSDTAHLSGVQTFLGPRTFAAGIIYDGNRSVTPGDGAAIHVDASDITDNNTSASGTATLFALVNIENPRVLASNALVTTNTAATVYIKGAPVASTNQTFTNSYALNVGAGNVKLGGGLEVTGIITGKQREVFFQNFFDDLGTTKHYLPFKSQSEQTTIYQEEAAVIMPCDGRIVSVTVRVNFPNADGDMTIGIHTRPVNVSAFTTASWVEEETETLTIENADDSHAFHFAFDNDKHFESSELVSISIQCASDISANAYWYVSTVVEYDWSTFLGTSSAEISTTP